MKPAETLADSTGRRIKVQPLSVSDQARMMRAIGAEQSANKPYTTLVLVACLVREVGEELRPFPRTEAQIDAALDKLGDEGVLAVVEWLKAEVAEDDSHNPLSPPAP